MKSEKLFKTLGGALAVGTYAVLVLLENRRRLRPEVESKFRRSARNFAVAGAAAIALQLAEKPIADRLTALVERKNIGLLRAFRLPRSLEIVLAIALLDYTLYVWHVLTHKIPFLWRFHVVHHIDLDLDASTALRFHFGEMTISAAWRAVQILIIGVSPASLAAWRMFLFPSILFHHSNVRLPVRLEKTLQKLIVTPRTHGIHHSIVKEETDSNWSSGLALWDVLHKTFRADAGQKETIVGVPAYREPDEITAGKLFKLPFEKQKPSWALPPARDAE